MTLRRRSDQAERMDTDCVDYDDYSRCLRDLSRVNVVTFTHRPMLSWLARRADGDFSLLDIACGHGDALRRSRHRYPKARLTGIDLNPWAIRAATQVTDPALRIDFVNDDAFAYQPAEPFDFIITSQFAHHLTNPQVVAFLRWIEAHAGKGWFIGDIHRHWMPYYGVPLLARLMLWHRFVREDGQISVARSFIPAEWEDLLNQAGIPGHRAFVAWYLPFRLCVGTR